MKRFALKLRPRRAKLSHKPVPVTECLGITALPQQPVTPRVVIDHQRPVVDTDRHFGQLLGVRGETGQPFEPAAEIVAEVTDGTAAERQAGRGIGARTQALAQNLERVIGQEL